MDSDDGASLSHSGVQGFSSMKPANARDSVSNVMASSGGPSSVNDPEFGLPQTADAEHIQPMARMAAGFGLSGTGSEAHRSGVFGGLHSSMASDQDQIIRVPGESLMNSGAQREESSGLLSLQQPGDASKAPTAFTSFSES